MKRNLITAAILLLLSIAAQATGTGKLSPRLAALSLRSGQAITRGINDNGKLTILAKLTEDADETALVRKYGFEVKNRIGRILIITIDKDQIAAMGDDPQVIRLEAERTPRKLLDVVPSQTGADKAYAGTGLPQAFTGKGVVVGIADAGFDYVNPFFRNAEGQTRVVWAKDYNKGGGFYTDQTAIWAAKHSSDASTEYHGSHVAGIAAGSKVNDINDVFYQGIAPEADIAMGCLPLSGDDISSSSATSLQAFSDIYEYAAQQNQPCVINFSAGVTMSLADNTYKLEEEGIRTLLNQPGRALVVAAGNQGYYRYLAHKDANTASGGAGVMFHQDDVYGAYLGVEVKMKNTQKLRVRYMNETYTQTLGDALIELSDITDQGVGFYMTAGTGQQRTLYLQTEEKQGDYTTVYLWDNNPYWDYYTSSQTKLNRYLLTVEGEGEAWILADGLCAPLEDVPAIENHSLTQPGYSIGWPASMKEVITVGNIAHRFKVVTAAFKYSGQGALDLTELESTKGEGYLSRSSSQGPSIDGVTKPDVCAPGVNVFSTYNNFVNESTDNDLIYYTGSPLDTEYEYENGGYFATLALTGTSMSAPAVAGTIALWMQADPTLTNDRIKDIIAHSARQPDSELTYPNNMYGYGEIDAYKGLLYLLDTNGILNVSRHQPAKANFSLQDRMLTIGGELEGNFSVKVYATDGRLLMAVSNERTLNLSQLPSGVYAVQLTTGDKATTGSTLIRL